MSLIPQISLSLGNKCNTVTIEELTGVYVSSTNIGGWGAPNIDTDAVTYAAVNVFPSTGSIISAIGTGEISGNLFTDTTHLSGNFAVGQMLTGTGILPGTMITGVITGTGNNNGGTYIVNYAQTVGPITISGTAIMGAYVLKDDSIDVYSDNITAPTPAPFIALLDQPWSNPDGIYEIVYTVTDGVDVFTNETQNELFLCNLCNCKDGLVTRLLDACSSAATEKLKEQVDQMEMFIYGIQSAYSCGDFDTAENILTAASTYCKTLSDCADCGCGGC
jgi:hypothetical protein